MSLCKVHRVRGGCKCAREMLCPHHLLGCKSGFAIPAAKTVESGAFATEEEYACRQAVTSCRQLKGPNPMCDDAHVLMCEGVCGEHSIHYIHSSLHSLQFMMAGTRQ